MAWPHFLDRDAPFTLCAGAAPGRTPGTSSSSKRQQGLFTPRLHKLIQQFAKYKNWWFFFFSKSLSWVPMPPIWHKACLPQQAPTSQPPGIGQLAGWHLNTTLCRAPNASEMYQTKAFSFKAGQNFPSAQTAISQQSELHSEQGSVKLKCWGFFFSLKVGQNLPTCPNSNQPTKQTGFRVRVQITEVGFFSSKGERVLSPHTSPNSTQSKPNTKTFCSGLRSKNPLAFIWVW